MLEGIGGILASSIIVVDETNEGSLTGRCMLEGRCGQLSEHVLPAGVSDAAELLGNSPTGAMGLLAIWGLKMP
jgi:hypothetical protein